MPTMIQAAQRGRQELSGTCRFSSLLRSLIIGVFRPVPTRRVSLARSRTRREEAEHSIRGKPTPTAAICGGWKLNEISLKVTKLPKPVVMFVSGRTRRR
jgi:ribosomal protein L32